MQRKWSTQRQQTACSTANSLWVETRFTARAATACLVLSTLHESPLHDLGRTAGRHAQCTPTPCVGLSQCRTPAWAACPPAALMHNHFTQHDTCCRLISRMLDLMQRRELGIGTTLQWPPEATSRHSGKTEEPPQPAVATKNSILHGHALSRHQEACPCFSRLAPTR